MHRLLPNDMQYPLRTRFASDIVTEFLQPKKPSNKVIILASGMPGMPNAKKVMYTIAKKGYWVFLPRYRGTWESGGTFLDHSPHEDILDVVGGVSKSFQDAWTNEEYTIENPDIYVIGSSFGGPAAILCSMDSRVTKAVAISPVVDWREEEKSPTEPMSMLGRMVKDSFGEAYRFSLDDWDKLARGTFYNPVDHAKDIGSDKIMLLHALDDDVVLYEPTVHFVKDVGCRFFLLKKGGHLGSSSLNTWKVGGKIWKFLETTV